jgi:hypothetical protein
VFVGYGFIGFLFFAFWIWALFDCIATDSTLVRNLPKLVWILLIVFLFAIGGVAWVLLGRPQRAASRSRGTSAPRMRRPSSSEDHPRYDPPPPVSDRRSAELDEQIARWERERDQQHGQDPGSP